MISIRGGYLVQQNEARYLAMRLSDISAVHLLAKGMEYQGEILKEAIVLVYTEPTNNAWWALRGPDALALPKVWDAYLTGEEPPKGEE